MFLLVQGLSLATFASHLELSQSPRVRDSQSGGLSFTLNRKLTTVG